MGHNHSFVHDLRGEIRVGDVLIWEPLVSSCSAVVVVVAVTRVDDHNKGRSETWVTTERWPGGQFSTRCQNSEDRVREACVRIPIRKVDEHKQPNRNKRRRCKKKVRG